MTDPSFPVKRGSGSRRPISYHAIARSLRIVTRAEATGMRPSPPVTFTARRPARSSGATMRTSFCVTGKRQPSSDQSV